MLNFFKTKTFKVASFVIAFAVMFTLSASAYTFSGPTMKQGSKGGEVAQLQTLVGAIADGNFGPATKAKVATWQATMGLSVDGVFGKASMAKANGSSMGGSYPAGCTSSTGFSSTTGMSCASTMTYPAGCTSAVGFSPTTGMSCAGGTNPGTSGVLTGGAGSATMTVLSTPSNNTKVGEGEVATKVLGVEVEADSNSDLAVTSMKVTLTNGGVGSKKLNRYAKTVSIWYNGTKVGSADASEFTETSNVYTKSISVSNAVVKAGKANKGKFYVAIDAVDNVDSGDSGSSNNTWTVTLTNTRYQDATGAVLTDTTGSLTKTFVLDTLSNTSDVELKVNLASDTVASKTVKLSTTTDTNGVEVMKFTMKAQGTKMHIDAIPVEFTTSESDLDDVTANVTLKINGQTFNETVSTSTSAVHTVVFDDLNLDVAADATITGTVYADMNDLETTSFDEGTTLTAQITSYLVTATNGNYIDVEDVNTDQLVSGDRTGSAQGNTLTFRSTGVNAVMGTPTIANTTDTNGNITSVTYTIPVAVTSFGNTLYMGQAAQVSNSSMTSTNAFNVVFENSSDPTTAVYTSFTNSLALSTSNATIDTNGFRLDDGTTKNFTLVVNATNPAVYGASYRVRLDQIQTWTNAALTAGNAISSLLPQVDFRTGYARIDN